MMKPWTKLAAIIRSQGVAAMVTVAELDGSGPREVGARMLVAPDGQLLGTIGGGHLEWQALAEVQRMMVKLQKAPVGKYFILGPELNQCCGGAVNLHFEIFDGEDLDFIRLASIRETEPTNFVVETKPLVDGAERSIPANPHNMTHNFERLPNGRVRVQYDNSLTPVWLFGAGHVGHALVNALAPLPFHVTWFDSRPDQFQKIDYQNVSDLSSRDPVADIDRCPPGAFVVIMTHSHDLDLELCEKALRAKHFDYVGVIGSQTKAARFRLRLKNNGLDENTITELVSPIGVDAIKGKEPAIVATSIVCQLLERLESRGIEASDRHDQVMDKDKAAHV